VELSVFLKGDFTGSHPLVTNNLTQYKADFNRIRLYKGFFLMNSLKHLGTLIIFHQSLFV
jgi:hypothetical protein